MKKICYFFTILILALLLILVCLIKSRQNQSLESPDSPLDSLSPRSNEAAIEVAAGANGEYIKWVDFNVTYEALCAAYDLDVNSYDSPVRLNWIELLAYVGAKEGGSFGKKSVSLLQKLADELSQGRQGRGGVADGKDTGLFQPGGLFHGHHGAGDIPGFGFLGYVGVGNKTMNLPAQPAKGGFVDACHCHGTFGNCPVRTCAPCSLPGHHPQGKHCGTDTRI